MLPMVTSSTMKNTSCNGKHPCFVLNIKYIHVDIKELEFILQLMGNYWWVLFKAKTVRFLCSLDL